MTDAKVQETPMPTIAAQLAAEGYPPAQAAMAVAEGKYAQAVPICRSWLERHPAAVATRLVYATALYQTDQVELAADELRHVLAEDPENVLALKLLSDIEFAAGNEFVALAGYRRILEIDPHCGGLCSVIASSPRGHTRTIILRRTVEEVQPKPTTPSKRIFFYTETMGDLYMNQGHPRLAAEVFRSLMETEPHPRLQEKLARARARTTERKS